MPGFQSFIGFLHHLVLAKLETSSIGVDFWGMTVNLKRCVKMGSMVLWGGCVCVCVFVFILWCFFLLLFSVTLLDHSLPLSFIQNTRKTIHSSAYRCHPCFSHECRSTGNAIGRSPWTTWLCRIAFCACWCATVSVMKTIWEPSLVFVSWWRDTETLG